MAPELEFSVVSAAAEDFCVTPTLALKLRIVDTGGDPIHSVALHTQIRLEAQRRRYDDGERARLFDLFGETSRWSQTLKSLLWTNTDTNVHGFTGSTEVDIQVPCTYDFNVLAARYLYALQGGSVPIVLLFSGSVFYMEAGALRVSMVSWNSEADFQLPVSAWREMMEMYYPNSAWLCLQRDAFDQLAAYKSRMGLATWEHALESLLAGQREQIS